MHTAVKLLVGFLVLAAVLAGVEITHPKGVRGLFAELTGSRNGSASAPRQGTGPAEKTATKAAGPTEYWGPGAEKPLAWGDRDYDRGDFDGAISNYGSARALAANPDERRRANQGLERSLLAGALVRGAAKTAGTPAELTAEAMKRVSAAESNPSEKTWLETVRWLAGAGQRERLPYAVGQALDLARPGGFVQGALEDALRTAEHRRDDLIVAMAGRGLATLPPPSSAGQGTASTKPRNQGAEETSGIGGVRDRGIPFGAFSAETREKLKKAARLEREGTIAYRAAGPDSPNRTENRHTAVACLKQVREIYQAALEEDSGSRDLDERLKDVMLMLAQLKKDEGIGSVK